MKWGPAGVVFVPSAVKPSPNSGSVSVVQGIAEALSLSENALDYALRVTTIRFVDDAGAMLEEAFRVVKSGSVLAMYKYQGATRG
jgi:ubiquinone/menaquinone biosynthesis C-methylase UbiE